MTTVTRWVGEDPPNEPTLEGFLRGEGLRPRWWSNGPNEQYGAHSHTYDKVLYCCEGSISFLLDSTGKRFELGPGDRLEIPKGTLHSAVVGPSGVACVEAAKPP
jgi:mannose-6-phosphate isomerase-like protein (cupin superfamily)